MRRLDRGASEDYFALLSAELGVPPDGLRATTEELDSCAASEVLWSEPGAGAVATINALRRRGMTVLVVSNSDGHAEDNLREAAVCQPGSGPGASVAAIVDSTLVGAEKPDPRIFEIALRQAAAAPGEAVHVGDMLSTDIAGARAAGIEPLHLDPLRLCRATDHRHIRTLAGIWRHIAPAV